MGIYVVEVFLPCDDTTDPVEYAVDCIGFEPDEVVPFFTEDANEPHCQFKDTKSQIQKVYRFIDWGNWEKVSFAPSIIPCPEPEEPVRPGLPEFIELEPPEVPEEIGTALCLEKVQQWQRNPHLTFFERVLRSEKTFLRSLEAVGAQRLRSSLSQQRRGLRGGVGTRRINLAGRSTVFDTIIQIIHARRYKNIHIARAGSRVALCFTTQSNRTHFLSSNGYRELLRELALERRPLK